MESGGSESVTRKSGRLRSRALKASPEENKQENRSPGLDGDRDEGRSRSPTVDKAGKRQLSSASEKPTEGKENKRRKRNSTVDNTEARRNRNSEKELKSVEEELKGAEKAEARRKRNSESGAETESAGEDRAEKRRKDPLQPSPILVTVEGVTEPAEVKPKAEGSENVEPEAAPVKRRGRKKRRSEAELEIIPAAPAVGTPEEPTPKRRGRKKRSQVLDSLAFEETEDEASKELEPKLEEPEPKEPEVPEPKEPEEPEPKSPESPDEKEEPLVWTDGSANASAVIWGDQITNSIKRLTNLKFFVVGNSVTAGAQGSGGSGEEGQGQAEEAKGRRRGKRGKKSAKAKGGRGGAGQGADFEFLANGMPVEGNFKVDSLFGVGGGEGQEGGMEGVEVVSLDPMLEEPGAAEPAEGADFFSVVEVEEGIVLDDVANFENVQSSDRSALQVSFQAYKKKKRASGSETVVLNATPSETTGKPNNTYTEIIGRALEDNPTGLTVSEIYEWISKTYPYYHPTDDRWKNSVRHNLSISPYFYKGEKSKNGAGHVWTLAENCKDIRPSSRRKSSAAAGPRASVTKIEDISLEAMKSDTDLAVASILGHYKEQTEQAEEGQIYEITIPNEIAIGNGSCQMNPNEGIEADMQEMVITGSGDMWTLSEVDDKDQAYHEIQQLPNDLPLGSEMPESILPMPKEGEVIEINMQDMAIQPGYTINLEELFGNQASYISL